MTTIAPRLTNALADRYRLEREIGAGGMATVYLAEDLKHHRKVAIKVLRPELAAALGPDRFMQEIAIAARLQHPHILAVHDSGEADGFLYYVMPYVEGESLRERLLRQGELPVPEAVRLLMEIADALAHAHACGVVHRDIKPENVMLSGRHALVMDFGVAKAVSEASEHNFATTVGVALGTPAYMAPEQATADPNLDHRADIYALGVLGYELLTGRPPFTEGSSQQILAAHLTKTPEMITVHRPGIPSALAAAIMQALAKQPADRWQTAEEMLAQLEPLHPPSGGMTPAATRPASDVGSSRRRGARYASVGLAVIVVAVVAILLWNRQPAPAASLAVVPTTRIDTADVAVANSIAVLPFVNMSSDKEQEYFSDGISEELLNQLAQIPNLRVIARTSSFAFKGKDIGVAEIARQLNVSHVLEGSIRKSGNKIRITAQLIRTADSSHLWSETYDRDAADVFAIQDEISAAVVQQLKLKLLGEAPKSRKTDPRAFALFLQGRASWRLNTDASIAQAIKQLRQAAAIDPGYADAWSGLSLSYSIQGFGRQKKFPANEQLMMEAANQALKADPENAPAHARLADAAENYRNDLATSAKHLERAVALGPTNTDVIDEVGNLYHSLARAKEAIPFHQYATRLDPMSAWAHSHLGYDYLSTGRVDESIGSGRIALALSPNSEQFRLSYAVALLVKADWPAVLAELPTWPEGAARRLALTQALRGLGRKAESDAALAELIRLDGDTQPLSVATAFAMRGNADQAFAWIDKALAQSPAMLNGAIEDPALANLRSDPRWLPKLRSLGQAPDQLAAIKFNVVLPSSPGAP